jgi:hypothetical protein
MAMAVVVADFRNSSKADFLKGQPEISFVSSITSLIA